MISVGVDITASQSCYKKPRDSSGATGKRRILFPMKKPWWQDFWSVWISPLLLAQGSVEPGLLWWNETDSSLGHSTCDSLCLERPFFNYLHFWLLRVLKVSVPIATQRSSALEFLKDKPPVTLCLFICQSFIPKFTPAILLHNRVSGVTSSPLPQDISYMGHCFHCFPIASFCKVQPWFLVVGAW